AGALKAYDRSVARERRLRVAATALAEASDRESICAAAVAGARELLADLPGREVDLATDGVTAGNAETVALVAHGRTVGTLVVRGGEPLDAELRDDLRTLGDLAALALESQSLVDAGLAGEAIESPSSRATPFER